MWDGHHHGFP
ncbi:hypothetical protein TIFTF001_053737 [Ficus carica]|uniref:Uncharacterized protein n=1 Tax=Ficus carica TaxID=3494 RepID=A0AA88JIE6_FICCA|nr:hypothetical protein TIFTF001_040814 [Ficus carica]GMN73716.1 hypothetical protein TIFTF001_053736 [Ficus carica]GMN73721.1 hypothetical protein TIFTF001_053737 [Ficus carica]